MRLNGPTVEIAVFARAPVAGCAKTRLAPRLGAAGAAQLQAWLTQRALARACQVSGARVTLWTSGDPQHSFWRDCEAAFGVALREQCGADLGARMHHAFASTLAANTAPMLLIGTDCPAQSVADLHHARAALADADLVIQPAFDGGYVLIGMKQPQAAVFDDIAWSTPSVAQATRERARAAGLALTEIETRPDLDEPADLDAALAAGWVAANAWHGATP
ncbi:MAG: TIGR04282 family arsenosugar biosynthesis glycosyltransferase [Burkholderiaceae bacterium]